MNEGTGYGLLGREAAIAKSATRHDDIAYVPDRNAVRSAGSLLYIKGNTLSTEKYM